MERASIVLASALALFAACTGQPQPPSRAAAPTPIQVDADTLFRGVADAMPDYADFLTVDELQQGLTALQAKYPDLVRLSTAGASAAGFPIIECQTGHGKRHALFFGFPHPNEPIGSMMLHYLTEALASTARSAITSTSRGTSCCAPTPTRRG